METRSGMTLFTLLVLGWLSVPAAAQDADICWKDTYGRGVGTIPSSCSSDRYNDAGLCYPQCRAGYKAAVTMCVPACPSGYTDTGLHCLKGAAYGRGGGFPWQFGDGLNLDGARSRCNRKHGSCEKCGEIMYPKCKTGFRPIGCNICSPTCPSGMTDIGVSCQKHTYDRGAGSIPVCSSDQDADAGLCYSQCRGGTYGVGPVCWSRCPSSFPVDCGAACGVSQSACGLAIANQVLSSGEVVLNVGALVTTGGAANGALQAARTAARTAGKKALSVSAREAAKQRIKSKLQESARWQARQGQLGRAADVWEDAEHLEMVSATLVTAYEKGEFDFETLFQWEDLDPTGIASVVKAFNKPICGSP